MRAFLLSISLAAGLGVATAQDLTDADRSAIKATVDEFGAAMTTGDLGQIAETIPPRILDHIAGRAGVDVATVRNALVAEMEKLSEQATIAEYRIDEEGMTVARLDDDTPYALLPTETIVRVGGRQARVSSQTLALRDGEEWYLVRVSDPQQVAILREVYPGFADVEFASSTSEVID